MKTLIVVHHFPPHISGVGNVAEKQARSMSKKGAHVTVLTTNCSSNVEVITRDGYKLHRLRASNMMEDRFSAPFPIFSPAIFRHAYKLVKDTDIVHIHDVFYISSHVSGLIAVIKKKPFFITQHVAMVDHPSKIVMGIQKLTYKTVGKFLFNRAEAIVVYNANIKDFLLELGVDGTKILQNYNGIDTDYFSPASNLTKEKLRVKYNIPTNKPVILFVGRLVPKKGFDLVFDARSNSYTTLIVGGGQVPNRMKNKENVIFFGSATQSQLADLYRLSDIFVSPALGELFTLVIQEAMACGLPVIMTDAQEYSQYDLKRNLLGFAKREAAAIKLKIDELLSDDDLRQKMGHYSRQLAVKNFSWQRNYKYEFEIYSSITEAS